MTSFTDTAKSLLGSDIQTLDKKIVLAQALILVVLALYLFTTSQAVKDRGIEMSTFSKVIRKFFLYLTGYYLISFAIAVFINVDFKQGIFDAASLQKAFTFTLSLRHINNYQMATLLTCAAVYFAARTYSQLIRTELNKLVKSYSEGREAEINQEQMPKYDALKKIDALVQWPKFLLGSACTMMLTLFLYSVLVGPATQTSAFGFEHFAFLVVNGFVYISTLLLYICT